jgi:hypothetical protein
MLITLLWYLCVIANVLSQTSWRICLFIAVAPLTHLCPIVDPVPYLTLHFTPHYLRIVRTLSAALYSYLIIDLSLCCGTVSLLIKSRISCDHSLIVK